jgi:hypothetical protein
MDHVTKLFGSTGKREAYRRIAEMEKAGLLKREAVLGMGALRIIRATPRGVVYGGTFEDIPARVRIDMNSLYHDATVTSVRLRLEELWDGWWYPEAMMKIEELNTHVPDGLFHFDTRAQIAIEVEHTQKERQRFQGILRHHQRSGNAFTLYVATTDTVQRFIQREIQRLSIEQRIGVVLWTELRDGIPDVWTLNGPKSYLKRRVLGERKEAT